MVSFFAEVKIFWLSGYRSIDLVQGVFFCGPKKVLRKVNHFKVLKKRN